MSRLIDGDALEELFREVISGIAKRPDMNGNMEHMIRASAMVIEMIKDAPTIEPESKWIPTSKKPDPDLPEEEMSGYFLVTLHTYGNIGFDMDEYEVKKMRWNRVNGWVLPVHSPTWIEEALTQDVLAWKPCPEPYREEGE